MRCERIGITLSLLFQYEIYADYGWCVESEEEGTVRRRATNVVLGSHPRGPAPSLRRRRVVDGAGALAVSVREVNGSRSSANGGRRANGSRSAAPRRRRSDESRSSVVGNRSGNGSRSAVPELRITTNGSRSAAPEWPMVDIPLPEEPEPRAPTDSCSVIWLDENGEEIDWENMSIC